jgi:hypothetical protein
LVREALEQLHKRRGDLESELAERLNKRLEDEREIHNDDGTTTILPDEELEQMRGDIETEIRDELQEEEEDQIEEEVRETMHKLQAQKDDDSNEDEDEQ